MNGFILSLRERLPFLNSAWFGWVYGIVVALNPLALLPQLLGVVVTREVAGLSVAMFVLFTMIQTSVALGAIKALDWKLAFSMSISSLETITIVVGIVVIRYF